MRAYKVKNILSEDYKQLKTLRGVMIRRGNRERSHAFILSLYKQLKIGAKGYATSSQFPFNTLDEKTPLEIILRCLYQLRPAFILRRVFVRGRFYELPVPISKNRACFMACNWLKKAALQTNKNDLTLPTLLVREIGSVFNNQGSSIDSLKAYIDIALDQLPFSHYLRKRRKVLSRSRGTSIGQKLSKVQRRQRKYITSLKGNRNNLKKRLYKLNLQKIIKNRKNYVKKKNKLIGKKKKIIIKNFKYKQIKKIITRNKKKKNKKIKK
jgi:hypothetical protein